MDVVKNAFDEVENEKKSINNNTINKLIDVECYLQDFVIVDTNEINLKEIRSENAEQYVKDVCRDNVQIFINKLIQLPVVKEDGDSFFELPDSVFPLPREKPIPVAKPLTKWQKFAREKGIQKDKKPRTTWDDILQRWVPTYGYKKAKAEKEKNWILEVPKNKDPYTDMFAEKQKVKKENIAKNEYQRLRNIAASKSIKVPKFGLPPLEGRMHVSQIEMAADIAKVSTASVGKFQPKLPNENTKKKNITNRKRNGKPVLNSEAERKANLSMAESVLKKKPKLDIAKAVNKSIYEEQAQRSIEKKEKNNKQQKGKQRKRYNGAKNQKGSRKPASTKGKPVGKKKHNGRKRR